MFATAPYPYQRLQKMSRAQVAAFYQLKGRWPRMEVTTALTTARRLLGVPCDATLGLPEPATMERARGCIGLVLDDANDHAATTLLLVPNALANHLADRALGGEGYCSYATSIDAWGTGALAYLAARVLAALQSPLSLREVTHNPIERLKQPHDAAVCVPLQLIIAGTPTWTALWFSSRRPCLAPASRKRQANRTWLGRLPMQLVAEAGVGVLTRGDIEELNVDDVFIPDDCQLRRGADGFAGPALLRFQDGHQGFFALTSNGSELRVQEPKLIEESTMTDDKPLRQAMLNQDALDKIVSLGRDAPVSITVELARFTLPLEDVAALQPGDIFNTHAPIGAQVTLRAAGVAIALGELIDIEGETGVRIIEVK